MRFSRHFTSFRREDIAMALLTAREAAQYLRVSLFTLGRIEKEGLLVPFRTPGGHRRYSVDMLTDYLERTRSQPVASQRRILVVDDGDELTEFLVGTFPSWRVTSAQDELDVGLKLAQFKPDLVLVNTAMREIDGGDLCRRLNGQARELAVLPFEAPGRTYADPASSTRAISYLESLKTSIALAMGPGPSSGSSGA
jgi:CheY-like chemotaxis protein